MSAVDQCIPTKSVKDTNSPSWIDSDLCHHIPKKYGALRKYRLNKSDDNKLKLSSLSQHVKYLVKRKHRLYLEKIEDVFSKNPKLFWSYQKAVLHHRAKPKAKSWNAVSVLNVMVMLSNTSFLSSMAFCEIAPASHSCYLFLTSLVIIWTKIFKQMLSTWTLPKLSILSIPQFCFKSSNDMVWKATRLPGLQIT